MSAGVNIFYAIWPSYCCNFVEAHKQGLLRVMDGGRAAHREECQVVVQWH